jgi:hypothetical protein
MSDEDQDWIAVSDKLPEQAESVETKIDDHKGVRNAQPLMLLGRLWFYPNGSMYVYYVPTHWRRKR